MKNAINQYSFLKGFASDAKQSSVPRHFDVAQAEPDKWIAYAVPRTTTTKVLRSCCRSRTIAASALIPLDRIAVVASARITRSNARRC